MKPASTEKGNTVYSVRAGLKPKPEWVLFPMYISAGVCCTLWDPMKKTTQYTNIYIYKCVSVCVQGISVLQLSKPQKAGGVWVRKWK